MKQQLGCLALISALAFGSVSCGGEDINESNKNEQTNNTPAEQNTETEIAWKDMNTSQRSAYMVNTVMPQMRELFVSFDEKYSAMNCATCHGANPAAVNFAMPNGVYPIVISEIAPMLAEESPRGDAARFMQEQVQQKMAELLGVQPFDPVTYQGFGCLNCHATAPEPQAQ